MKCRLVYFDVFGVRSIDVARPRSSCRSVTQSVLQRSNSHCRNFPVKRSNRIPNPMLLHVSHSTSICNPRYTSFCNCLLSTHPYCTFYSKPLLSSGKLLTKVFALGINSCMVTGIGKDGIVSKVYNTGVKRLTYYQLSPTIWLVSHLHSMLTMTVYLLGVVVVVVGAENVEYGHN